MGDPRWLWRPAGFDLPHRRRRLDPNTVERRRLSRGQREVDATHAAQRGLGERAYAMVKSWTILRNIGCCQYRTTALVNAVQVLILAD